MVSEEGGHARRYRTSHANDEVLSMQQLASDVKVDTPGFYYHKQ